MGERVLVLAGVVLGAVALVLGVCRLVAGGPDVFVAALCLSGLVCLALGLSLLPDVMGRRR